MTLGKPKFKPEKTQNIVSNDEFEEIRKEMINLGGSDLKIARFLYYGLFIYGAMSLIWLIIYTFAKIGKENGKTYIAWEVITWAMIIIPNIIMTRCWKIYMQKASEAIQRMFDRQNMASYNVRGVSWSTRQTLLYIHIRIFDPQLRLTGHLLTMGPGYFNRFESQAPTNVDCETPPLGGSGGLHIPYQSQFKTSMNSHTGQIELAPQHIALQAVSQIDYQALMQNEYQSPQNFGYQSHTLNFQALPAQDEFQVPLQNVQHQHFPEFQRYQLPIQEVRYEAPPANVEYQKVSSPIKSQAISQKKAQVLALVDPQVDSNIKSPELPARIEYSTEYKIPVALEKTQQFKSQVASQIKSPGKPKFKIPVTQLEDINQVPQKQIKPAKIEYESKLPLQVEIPIVSEEKSGLFDRKFENQAAEEELEEQEQIMLELPMEDEYLDHSREENQQHQEKADSVLRRYKLDSPRYNVKEQEQKQEKPDSVLRRYKLDSPR